MYLEEYGISRAIPDLRKIVGTKIWEVRILGNENIRIFCAGAGEGKVIVLHVFIKKKQKTPIRELNLAIKRLDSVMP